MINVEIHDTSGDEHLNVNRQVQYNKADVFVCCVAANSIDSIHSVEKWASEIRTVCPNAPIVLVLTKKDLIEYVDEPVTKTMVEEKNTAMNF